MNDKQQEGVRFAEIVLGVRVSNEPPLPGTRLARLMELDAQCAPEGVSDAEFCRRASEL
jgi:hypothetical protein